jgi:hypothetical protein
MSIDLAISKNLKPMPSRYTSETRRMSFSLVSGYECLATAQVVLRANTARATQFQQGEFELTRRGQWGLYTLGDRIRSGKEVRSRKGMSSHGSEGRMNPPKSR